MFKGHNNASAHIVSQSLTGHGHAAAVASAAKTGSCQQQQHGSSLGQRVTGMFKGHNNADTHVVSQSSTGHGHAGAVASAAKTGSCQQQQQHGSSLGQRVTEMFKGHNNTGTHAVSQSSARHGHAAATTKTVGSCGCSTRGHAAAKSCGCSTQKQTATHHQGTATNSNKCNGNGSGRRSRREHGSSRGGLFQKIKDGLSGHSSDSSSSESDSDNEGCRTGKNCN